MKTRFVLSIDGGGVRGIVAAVLLDSLEGELRNAGVDLPVSDVFDVISGTSTGAIIAAGLSSRGPEKGRPLVTPADLRDLFRQHAKTIFPPRHLLALPFFRQLRQLFGPLYSAAPLQRLLDRMLQDQTFLNPRRNVLITAYSVDPREAVFFRGGPHTPPGDPLCTGAVRMADAVVGSAAAPTFFPPHRIVNPKTQWQRTVIDGGVFINDPAVAGFAEALRLFPDDDVKVVSLGTGRITQPYPFDQSRSWGFLQWVSPAGEFRTPLLSAMADGQARAVTFQMERLLGERYQRFDYDLARGYGSPALDDGSPSNMKALENGALNMAEEMRPRLRKIAQEIAWVYGKNRKNKRTNARGKPQTNAPQSGAQ